MPRPSGSPPFSTSLPALEAALSPCLPVEAAVGSRRQSQGDSETKPRSGRIESQAASDAAVARECDALASNKQAARIGSGTTHTVDLEKIVLLACRSGNARRPPKRYVLAEPNRRPAALPRQLQQEEVVAAAVLTEERLGDDEEGPLCRLPALSSSGGQHPHRQSHAGQV